MNGKIYAIVNLINWKLYIGQTRQTQTDRKRDHFKLLKKGIHFNEHLQNAANLYKLNNFEFILLEDNILSLEKLNLLEKEYIKIFCSNNRRYGYNKTDGGMVSRMSEETKSKISKAKLGRKNPKYSGVKNHMFGNGWRVAGYRNPMYGKKRTYKERVANSRRNGFAGCWLKHKRFGRRWCGIQAEFAKKYNMSVSGINQVITKLKRSCKGWQLATTKFTQPATYKIKSPAGKVYQFQKRALFAREHNLNISALVDLLNKKRIHHKGWTL